MGIKITNQCQATDENGQVYELIKYEERPTGQTILVSPNVNIPEGRKQFWQLSDGRDLNDIGDEVDELFEIVDTGEKLRRV